MTCIIGVVQNGRVFIGADSCVRAGDDYSFTEEKKIYSEKNMIFGTAGTTRSAQIFLNTVRALTDEQLTRQVDPEDFIYNTLLPAFHENLDKAKVLNSEGEFGGEIMVGFAGKVWTIGCDLSILFISSGFTAIGSGAPFARGALQHMVNSAVLYGLKWPGPIRTCIKSALAVAAHFTSGVCEPFFVEMLEPPLPVGQAMQELKRVVGPFLNGDEPEDGSISNITGEDQVEFV